jgi:uncharacterized protein
MEIPEIPELLCKKGDVTYTTDGSFIYAEKEGKTYRLDLFDRHYYKLRPVNGVPILEVDGLRMHLVRDFKTPLDYSDEVVKALRIPPSVPVGAFSVFDTCMGLGYTAIAAAKLASVDKITTCEISDAVMTLAKWNPWSGALWENSKITIMQGNSADIVKTMPDCSFDFIIHDPPRFTHSSELYSGPFYAELFRVCKPGARIFHYVGSVGAKSGRHIEREVGGRLEKTGFTHIKYIPKLQGMIAARKANEPAESS